MGGFQYQSVSVSKQCHARPSRIGANQADDCELLMGTSRCPSTGAASALALIEAGTI